MFLFLVGVWIVVRVIVLVNYRIVARVIVLLILGL